MFGTCVLALLYEYKHATHSTVTIADWELLRLSNMLTTISLGSRFSVTRGSHFYMSCVEAFATGIKIGSSDQSTF